ncbi:hypothetical protein FRUB_09894 [Fimbriiglobus ruber]|uniref:FtsH ternary system domain-containing protein n=1 Tax=Fimbriiglobus ruber TaxID=1908690 RepID=A0A225D0M0_9BACT|nr:hypothetical protein FRUB_09894 [Fimbriiglobus ruber]
MRLALASGIIPPEVAREAVRAAVDENGRVWVEMPDDFPRDSSSALTRIGVTLHGPGTGPAARDYTHWAELLPLRSHPAIDFRGEVLVDVPDSALARLVGEIRRVRPQPIAVRMLPETGRGWILVRDPPLYTVLGLSPEPTDSGSEGRAEVFFEQAPRVWVLAGWHHPLDSHLSAPGGTVALVRPGQEWEYVPDEPFNLARDGFALSAGTQIGRTDPAATVVLTTKLSLTRTQQTSSATESLWVLPGEPAETLAELARDTDEQLLRRFRACVLTSPQGKVTVVRAAATGKGSPPVLSAATRGYVPHTALSNLYLQPGTCLSPAVRPQGLAKLLGLTPDLIAWATPEDGGRFAVHRAPVASFRAVADWVSYRVPTNVSLAVAYQSANYWQAPAYVLAADKAPAVPSPVPAVPPAGDALKKDAASGDREGWISRSLGKLAGRLMPGASPGRIKNSKRRSTPAVSDAEPSGRVGEKLASTQALLLGNEWSARRTALEQRVLTDLPRLPPAERTRVWVELAEVYSAVGYPADAAVCWLNAVWDSDPPPVPWVDNWLRAEAKTARVAKGGREPEVVFRAAPVAAARVAAAHLVWAAGQPTQPAETVAHLPRFLALLGEYGAEIPARALWLARIAAARLSDGDALGLARCRDQVFRRLVEKGPGLDLDAPSFLRFRGGIGGDRFVTARDWLARAREPVHRWIARFAHTGRLQWAGIDAETECTTAYADLLFAWGLSKLGDRSRSREMEASAGAVLSRVGGPSADPMVHRVLRAAFADRIAAAQDGRPDRPGLPLDAAADLLRLDDLGRYAVEKLRAHCRILEPVDLINPYRNRDLGGFLGSDALGERLARVLARPDLAPDPGEIRGLLADAAADPTASTLPRVVFVLVETAPRLDPQVSADVLPLVPRAIELTPEWVRVAVQTTDPAAVTKRFGARMMTAACHVAVLAHLPDSFRRAADAVLIACDTPGSSSVRAVEQVAGPFFRCLRRLGLHSHASELLGRLDEGNSPGPRELGLAVGWFAAGNEDAGNRTLNAARDRLFVSGVPDDRERTALALAYAVATGHAPPRIALGRLEELFLRLDIISAHGATNRYFTLKPLELIDTVIRAVVSDDFCLGPGVRGWLDDDEFLIRRRVTRDLAAVLGEQ